MSATSAALARRARLRSSPAGRDAQFGSAVALPVVEPPAVGWLRRAVAFACALSAVFLAVGLVATARLAQTATWTPAHTSRLPLLALLGAASYLLRFARWHLLIRRVAPALRLPASLRIYMAGFAMGLTPGRVGEFAKFSLLREETGVPEALSAPVFPLERMTEAASFTALALSGALLGHLELGRLRTGALVTLVAVPALALLGVALRFTTRKRGQRRPRGRSWLHLLLDGTRSITAIRTLALATLFALAARTCDTLLFWGAASVAGLALPLPAAALAWGLAGLAGGLLLLPGGVGAVEGSLVATVAALGGDPSSALTAALLARCLTLWLWVPAGLLFAARGVAAAGLSAPRPGSSP
jgi:uncharacterized membrane protein YbhN (UPF0104 family)